ncbi:MAG: hypothetical protein ACRD47_17140 [Nitrososphaeraceae archaeon]
MPYQIPYSEWTVRWWKWIYSIPKDMNPINESASVQCNSNQHDPAVLFLAGGKNGIVERECNVAVGKAILLPVLNWSGTFADEPKAQSEEDLVSIAKQEIDIVSGLEAQVDGVQLENLHGSRVRTGLFDVVLPENSIFGGEAGSTQGISDGYWLFLRPLSLGRHLVHSYGSCQIGRVRISVRYILNVS